MAGLWNLSGMQLHDLNGKPYPNALAEFFASDSLEPITVFADYGLGTELPNPVRADGTGIFPYVYLDEDDEFFRQRLKTAEGVIIGGTDQPIIPIIGPSGGGGGSDVPVDPNALYKTGDLKWRMGTGVHAGFVRVNGRTIGSATSGASERANSDAEQLYTHIWTNFSDEMCQVTGGRGANAAADFADNKPIQLPNARGCTLAALDDMGNTAAGRLTTATFSADGQGPTVLGAVAGAETITLTKAQLPVLGLVANVTDPTHDHGFGSPGDRSGNNESDVVHTGNAGTTYKTAKSATGITVAIPEVGGGEAHSNLQNTMLATLYVRL